MVNDYTYIILSELVETLCHSFLTFYLDRLRPQYIPVINRRKGFSVHEISLMQHIHIYGADSINRMSPGNEYSINTYCRLVSKCVLERFHAIAYKNTQLTYINELIRLRNSLEFFIINVLVRAEIRMRCAPVKYRQFELMFDICVSANNIHRSVMSMYSVGVDVNQAYTDFYNTPELFKFIKECLYYDYDETSSSLGIQYCGELNNRSQFISSNNVYATRQHQQKCNEIVTRANTYKYRDPGLDEFLKSNTSFELSQEVKQGCIMRCMGVKVCDVRRVYKECTDDQHMNVLYNQVAELIKIFS